MPEPPPASAARRHVPVLLDRVRALLAPALAVPGAVLLDATVGLGGHAAALLDDHPGLRLVGIDRDPEALAAARTRLRDYAARTVLVHAVFDELPTVLGAQRLSVVDGVLFDLGVSSLQIDETGRGFAYAQDAPLDMRMDQAAERTAADVLNRYPVDDLARVLRNYGDERYARRIARAVAVERERAPFTTSARLVDVIRGAIPAPARRSGGHPAKRVFQALRIEVNGELATLQRAVPIALSSLGIGGRIAVLAYQSLEDRIVKRLLSAGAADRTPPGLPVRLAERAPELRLLTRGAEVADDAEIASNPRAASARLRAAERVRDAG